MNEIYLSVFIMNLAESMISIFVPIYLYSLHYSIVYILFFFLIGHIGNVVFAVPIARLTSSLGSKHAVLISVPFLVIYYLGLKFLPEIPWLFYIIPLGITFRSLLYNFGFELNYIDHLDRKKVGKELSSMAILSIMGSVLSPLLAGFVIVYSGYGTIFLLGIILLVISTIPLLLSPDKHPEVNFTLNNIWKLFKLKSNAGMIFSYTGYAIESSIGRNIWPVFLIILLGTTEKVGYLVAISAFITVVVIGLTGRLADRYDYKKLLKLGTMFYFFGWLGCLMADTATKVLFINSYKDLAGRFLQIPWSSIFYRIINRDSYFQLVVLRDMIFNASRALVLPFIMLIFVADFYPFTVVFIIAALFTLLYPLFKVDIQKEVI